MNRIGRVVVLSALAAVATAGAGALRQASRVMAETPSSAELFMEVAPVFQHRRCMNCHVLSPFPRQGEDGRRHLMNVAAGIGGVGSPGMPCSTCHREASSGIGVPSAPGWHLAPLKMGWEGMSSTGICRALRDPVKSGMTPQQLVDHLATDRLVLWAWEGSLDVAGNVRSIPPLSHSAFLEGVRRWLNAGGECPQ